MLLTAFGRAVSEVGAVMIVGGNIDGVTRVITTTIALETSKGDLPLALALGLILLVVVGVINARGRPEPRREAAGHERRAMNEPAPLLSLAGVSRALRQPRRR